MCVCALFCRFHWYSSSKPMVSIFVDCISFSYVCIIVAVLVVVVALFISINSQIKQNAKCILLLFHFVSRLHLSNKLLTLKQLLTIYFFCVHASLLLYIINQDSWNTAINFASFLFLSSITDCKLTSKCVYVCVQNWKSIEYTERVSRSWYSKHEQWTKIN